MAKKLGLWKRVSNAYAAFRGSPPRHAITSMSVELHLDTTKFDAALRRARREIDRLWAEAEAATTAVRRPSPRLMLQADHRIPSDRLNQMREHLSQAIEQEKSFILDQPGLTLHQLVDGRWTPIASSTTKATLVEVPIGQG